MGHWLSPVYQNIPLITSSAKPSPISFTLVLHGLKLLFLEDESNQNSRAVIGKVFGKVLYLQDENSSEQYHIQSSKLQLFVNNVHASVSFCLLNSNTIYLPYISQVREIMFLS